MKLSHDDTQDIVNKVTNGGGGGNYTPLEAELARMCLKYRATIGRIAAEKSEMFNDMYSVYNTINRIKFASELREKHRNVLASNSRKAFTEAVKLDKELKEYGNED